MKIALVHDQLGEFGGAERVLLALSEMWPEAPIYTAYYRKGSPAWERFKDRDIRPSWAQRIPGFATRLASPLRFLAPQIWGSFDFSSYDLVISSASWYITKGFGIRGTKGKKGPIEICYCHTPPRWLYGYPTSVNWQKYGWVRAYATIVGFFMRQYDFEAAQKVDYFIANSKETQKRIQKFYRRDSTVIYPPATLALALRAGPPIESTQGLSLRSYYLFVSRPVGSKGLDLAVAAAKKLGFYLKVVGSNGANEKNIEFLGYVSDQELAKLYAGAKAFLALATDEDFGMTPVEAMSMGTPVIAYAGGGYTESVVDGNPSTRSARSGQGTGIFFDKPTVESLVDALGRFEKLGKSGKNWEQTCIAQAEKFSKVRFQKELRTFVTEKFRAASR